MIYSIIYADPPWHCRGRKQFGFAGDVGVDTGGAVNQYKTIPTDTLCSWSGWVKSFAAEDAVLFMWIPGPLLLDGLVVGYEWGFEYKRDAFQWNKKVTNPGYYTLTQIETCYVFKRGRIPKPRGSRKERQYVETEEFTNLDMSQYIEQHRGKHSAKPTEVRDRITRMFPTQAKIELFARERSPGWTAWGDEI